MNRWLTAVVIVAACFSTAAGAQGAGDGKGGGGRDGGGKGDCADGLRLFDGDELVWTHAVESFTALAATEPVGEGHRPDRPALSLKTLTADDDDVRRVEVAACGGRAQQLRRHELRTGGHQFYVVANRRGAFKFVRIHPNGREEILVRNVGRITIKRRE